MKRLFTLLNEKNKPYTSEFGHKDQIYFDSKQTARSMRNRLNEETSHDWHISLGPDHMGYHGIKSKLRGDRKS